MAEPRGDKTTLTFGGVDAEVKLVKTSSKPSEAKHETKWVKVEEIEPGEGTEQEEAYRELTGTPSVQRMTVEHEMPADPDPPDPEGGADPFAGLQATETVLDEAVDEPEEVMQHGVTTEAGEWVDLTDLLDAIDDSTKIEGLEIVAVVAQTAIPITRVRDSHYIAPAGEGASNMLAHLWHGLRGCGGAGLIRRTKRTNQALGAIVARGGGSAGKPHLALLELEWQANMRDVPKGADLTSAILAVSERGSAAALALAQAFREPPSVFEDLRDERTGQRAELLEAARAGQKWAPPEPKAKPEASDEFSALVVVGS